MIVLIEDQNGPKMKDLDFMKIQTLGDIYSLVNDLKKDEDQVSPQ
jgi:acyl carrier protein